MVCFSSGKKLLTNKLFELNCIFII